MAVSGPVRWSFPAYPGFQVFQYAAGTTTKQPTYTTNRLAVANRNPLRADAHGLLGPMCLDQALSYKFVLAPSTDSDPPTSPIFTQDHVTEQLRTTLAVLAKTADYTVVADDGPDVLILADATLGDLTVTLYSAAGNSGKKVRVVKVDRSANTVTIDPRGAQTWNGAATKVLGRQYDAASGVSDNAHWVQFSDSPVLEQASVLAKTADYTVVADDGPDVLIAADASGGAFTITLYAADGTAGHRVCVKKTDRSAHAVTIDGSGTDTIDGARTVTLARPHDVVWMESDGTNWHAIVPVNTAIDETHHAPSIRGGTLTLDLDVSRVFRVVLDADITTLTLQHVPGATRRAIVEVRLTGDGTARTFAWLTDTVQWPGGVAPTVPSTAGQVDWVVLWTDDGGTTWFGSVVGQGY